MKYCLLIFFMLPVACFAQVKIRGKVITETGGTSVPDASVFLNNTTIGAKSQNDGSFALYRIPPGQYNLVVTVIGFERYHKTITVSKDQIIPDIKLTARVTMLKPVSIGTKSRWKELSMFKDYFLGQTPFASQCKLKNPEVLDLYFSNQGLTLTGHTNEFLEIDNDALGYKLKYLVDSFLLDKEAGTVSYEGNVLFAEKAGSKADSARWKKNREGVYTSSPTHFLREVLADNVEQDFLVRSYCFKYKDKVSGQFVYDTLSPAKYIHKTEQPGVYAINYPAGVDIYYYKTRKSPLYGYVPRSKRPGLRVATVFFIDEYLLFDSNGTILNPTGALFMQAWAVARVAQQLPTDYRP